MVLYLPVIYHGSREISRLQQANITAGLSNIEFLLCFRVFFNFFGAARILPYYFAKHFAIFSHYFFTPTQKES
jgi:hypothetical protein